MDCAKYLNYKSYKNYKPEPCYKFEDYRGKTNPRPLCNDAGAWTTLQILLPSREPISKP